MAKLTEKGIAALTCPPGRKDQLVFDETVPGLGVRVSSTAKTFLTQYTAAGRRRRIPIGRWGAISLEQARQAARGILGDVAKGQDPAQQRAEARAQRAAIAATAQFTLDVLLQEWGALALASRRDSYRKEALRALRFAFSDHLQRPAAALTRAEAVKVLDTMVHARKTAIAGRTLAYGRACYAWARRRGRVEINPFDELPIPAGTTTRDRVLSAEEIAVLWQAMSGLGWPFGSLLQLLLLTVQRRDEVAGMYWSEISSDGAVWTIPKERAKNRRAHVVALAPAAQKIIASLPRFGSSDLVFTTNGKSPVSGFTKAKDRLDRAAARIRGDAAGSDPIPIAPWHLHDFRRSAVTWMASAGIAPHVCDRLLNHVTGAIQGVAAVYQRAEFLSERKAALEAWAAHLVASTGTARGADG